MPLKHNSCAVGRSHVISPRDGAFTLLAGSGAGCRPGAPSLFKKSPQTPLPGSRRDGTLSRAVGRTQSCSGVPAGAPRSGRSRINARLFKYQYQYQSRNFRNGTGRSFARRTSNPMRKKIAPYPFRPKIAWRTRWCHPYCAQMRA